MTAERGAPSTIRYAVKRYLALSLVALVVIGIATVLAARALAADVALRQARDGGATFARRVAAPLVTPKLRTRDPAAIASVNAVLLGWVRDGTFTHVKLWLPDGTVIWADEPDQIGQHFDLEDDEKAVAGTTNVVASVSDLSKQENATERASGELLEVYAGAFGSDGAPVLVETYWSTEQMNKSRQEILTGFGALGLGTLGLLQLILVPLALALARRVDRARAERTVMVRHALSASDLERRRIAQDLHDGLIQDLSGLGYALPAVAQQLPPDATKARDILAALSTQLHRDVTALRSLITDIYPADLADGGFAPAIEELAQRARESGLEVTVNVDTAAASPPEAAQLSYRVVREGLRNVVRHAQATTALVTVQSTPTTVEVVVEDDGVGIPSGAAAEDGHVGLRLLGDTLRDVGGSLALTNRDGHGARLVAQFPRDLHGD